MKKMVYSLILILIFIFGCEQISIPQAPGGDELSYPDIKVIENPPQTTSTETMQTTTSGSVTTTEQMVTTTAQTITTTTESITTTTQASEIQFIYTEGELVKIPKAARDADGDPLTYVFSAPLDIQGEWQTKVGDAGKYNVIVSVSDGKSTVKETIEIIVTSANQAPTISMDSSLTIQEGDLVELKPTVADADGDDVSISFSGWMTEAQYQTNYKDAGTHKVTITATDGKQVSTKDVTILVLDKNRAPKIGDLMDYVVKEGALIQVNAVALDEDSDPITIGYGAPLDAKGEWQTQVGDAGSYVATVTASDSKETTTKQIRIVVNRANARPVMEDIPDQTVTVFYDKEPRTVSLDLVPTVTDADGDKITLSYSGFMTQATKIVTWEDAGEHNVLITASDGKDSVSQTVKIIVNRGPCFCWDDPCTTCPSS